MKRIICTILCLVMVVSLCPFTVSAVPVFSNEVWDGTIEEITYGDGTIDRPYIISTPGQWQWFAEDTFNEKYIEQSNRQETLYFKLENDLYFNDISDFDLWGTEGHDDSSLNGKGELRANNIHIDGNGHTIYGMYALYPFYQIYGGTVVENLRICNSYFAVSSFCYMLSSGTIKNCCTENNKFFSLKTKELVTEDTCAIYEYYYYWSLGTGSVTNFSSYGEDYIIKTLGYQRESTEIYLSGCCNFTPGGKIVESIDGSCYDSTFSSCYSFGEMDEISQYTGSNNTVTNCRTITAAEAKLRSTFVGFDFENVWQMGDGAGYEYPTLRMFKSTSEHVHTYADGEVYAATCTADGYTIHRCTECNYFYCDNVVTAPDIDLSTTTAENPYLIETPEQLAYFNSDFYDERGSQSAIVYLKLSSDIYINDISEFELWGTDGYDMSGMKSPGLNFYRIVLDGNGKTIYGLNRGFLYNFISSTVKNLRIKNYYCSGNSFAGVSVEASIDNCCMEDNAAKNCDNSVLGLVNPGADSDSGTIIKNFYCPDEKYIINDLPAEITHFITVENCCNFSPDGKLVNSIKYASDYYYLPEPSVVGCCSFGDIANITEMKTKFPYADITNTRQITAAEAKLQSTFVGFDFVNTWQMGENYPVLQMFTSPDEHTEHTYTAIEIAATCLTEGYTMHKCTACSYFYCDNVTPALGHDFSGNWTVTKLPTCTAAGSMYKTCSRCTVQDVKTLDKTAHTSVTVVIQEPTFTAVGYEVDKCSICGATLSEVREIAMIAHEHTYATAWTIDAYPTAAGAGARSHHCTLCGASDAADTIPARTPGDANGDGKFNALDLLQVKLFMSGKRDFDDYAQISADVTRDGKVNAMDLLKIKLIMAGKTEA